MANISVILLLSSVAMMLSAISLALPVLDMSSGIDNATLEELRASAVNGSPKSLYVVRAVVYEIGILTEADENDTSFESQERVDLTFFDAHTNESHIDLGNIPLPIQTNISGQVLTGIAPVHLGAFSDPSQLLSTLPLTGSIVNITHSNTAYYQLTRSNVSAAEKPQVIHNDQLTNFTDLAQLLTHAAPQDTVASVDADDAAGNNALERNDD